MFHAGDAFESLNLHQHLIDVGKPVRSWRRSMNCPCWYWSDGMIQVGSTRPNVGTAHIRILTGVNDRALDALYSAACSPCFLPSVRNAARQSLSSALWQTAAPAV